VPGWRRDPIEDEPVRSFHVYEIYPRPSFNLQATADGCGLPLRGARVAVLQRHARRNRDGRTGTVRGSHEPRVDHWGIGEPIAWFSGWPRHWDIDASVSQLLALKPMAFRQWLSISDVLTGPTTVNEAAAQKYDQVIERLQQAGVRIIAMDHSFPDWMTSTRCENAAAHDCIPRRDMSEGSPYRRFLQNYQTAWTTLARRFSQITYWETGNEYNHVGFLKPPAGHFSYQQMADITLDLMYRAQQAIRSVRSDAVIYTPGFAPIKGDTIGIAYIGEFLQLLYDRIHSGQWPSANPRDYFDGVAWHPYVWDMPTVENWVRPNQAVYEVMARNGDTNVPVLFSEYGNSDDRDSQQHELMVQRMHESYRLAAQHFGWLDTFIWFRMLDDPHAVWAPGEMGYGVMLAPDEGYGWKPSAVTFRDLACHSPASGFFRIGPTIYYSNGQDAYCAYTSWEAYLEAGGAADLSNIRNAERLPNCLRDDGVCR
jgi:hypothetical protein